MDQQAQQFQAELNAVKAMAFDKQVQLEGQVQQLTVALQEILKAGDVESVDALIAKLKPEEEEK